MSASGCGDDAGLNRSQFEYTHNMINPLLTEILGAQSVYVHKVTAIIIKL